MDGQCALVATHQHGVEPDAPVVYPTDRIAREDEPQREIQAEMQDEER